MSDPTPAPLAAELEALDFRRALLALAPSGDPAARAQYNAALRALVVKVVALTLEEDILGEAMGIDPVKFAAHLMGEVPDA